MIGADFWWCQMIIKYTGNKNAYMVINYTPIIHMDTSTMKKTPKLSHFNKELLKVHRKAYPNEFGYNPRVIQYFYYNNVSKNVFY